MPLSFQSFSATTRPTAFGIYDADDQFREDANEVIYFIQRMLGTPVLDSELDVRQIWTAFEASTMEYSSMINNHHARNTLLDHLGRPTGSLSGSEGSLPLFNTAEFSRKVLIQYAAEAGVNSPYPTFTSSVDLVPNVQRYDLLSIISGSGHLSGANAGQLVQIRKVHHYEPTSAYRFFDTTSMTNFMANNMNFASYSPETIFYMLPIWEDILRGTQLQLNQRVRRSNYSFDINGYELIVYPTPNYAKKLYFEWTVSRDPLNASIGGVPVHQSRGVTSNISNLAFGHLGYSHINSMGRKWIFDYTLAICKELVGNIRNKYGGLPIPNGNITLNGSDLIAQGQREMENLKQMLRELLDQLSYKNLMQERMEIEDMAVNSFRKVPLLIYLSR
jgi:hypothetical protein